MDERDVLDELLPPNLKIAMLTGNADKIAEASTGLDKFEFQDIAAYLGTKIATRHRHYQKVGRGLLALKRLGG